MNITFVRQVNVIKVKLVKQPGICYHENVQLEKLFTKTALDENHRVNLNGAGNRPQEEYLFFFRGGEAAETGENAGGVRDQVIWKDAFSLRWQEA